VGSFICGGVLASTTLVNTTTQTTPLDETHPSPQALTYAINAYQWALEHNQVKNPNILTVVDFNLPSFDKRLWVINLKNDEVMIHTYVAQGKNTGAVYATHFSNRPESLESSPGIYTTGKEYMGEHGHSLRVNGLEAGINNNAYSREIVIHPASYVGTAFVKANGYAGRSWGCFAVSERLADRIIAKLKNGTVLFADAPSEQSDPRVNHSLSAEGRVLYAGIMNGGTENPVERFFEWL
jgi:L,D-transpeptidase catalytic domain